MNYIEKYCKYFGYVYDDYIPSELSRNQSVDVHHIIFRSKGGKDNIENLMALTREEHDLSHFIGKKEKWLSAEYLQEKHNKFLENFKKIS